jgi:antitoxin component YwqK of YwqJK toxin-antitoxin module
MAQNAKDAQGKKHGKWILRGKDKPGLGYSDETIVEQGSYSHGRKTGVWIKFHKDGKTAKLKGNYINNRPSGNYTRYYANGKLKESGFFSDEKQQGTLTKYYSNGQISYQASFGPEGKENGTVKHYYGFKYALGGIVVMKGADFERTNGFPGFWGWGMEDNVLQKRCEAVGLNIDRSLFYNIGSPEILQLFDGISRIISKKDPWRGEYDNGIDGLKTITHLRYTIDEKSENPHDNIFVINNPKIMIINISTFLTHIPFGKEEYYNYDLREPKRKIIHPDKIRETTKSVSTTNDWSNIPYYPTTLEKKENMVKYLIAMGKEVPQNLLQQIEIGRKKEIANDAFNNFTTKNKNIDNRQIYIQPSNFGHQRQVPNNFSPQYASYIGAKPTAQASAKIRLGGVY